MAAGRLEGKVALVTGGASGIGRASTLRFCAEGARVVMADYNEASGDETLALAEKAGVANRVRFVRTDVSAEEDVAEAVARTVDEFGRLDVVFNNAGVGGAFGTITDIHVEDWDYTFAVLVRGVFLGTKHAARVMRDQGGGGAIVNTASVAGLSGGGGPQAYSAAKAAVINFTRTTAVELAPQRIRVNAICPGVILTPLLHRGREEKMAHVIDSVQPWPDGGRPEDIAAAALYLASDEARFVTGEALVVDGGLTAAGPAMTGPLQTDASKIGLTGVNRGTTGQGPTVRGAARP